MEEESDAVLVPNAVEVEESSDSNVTTEVPRWNNGGRFKGIVVQPNGNCGAQIYANHQRIWLGTFSSDVEAAKAYNSAAIKLRGNDNTDRNFPLRVSELVFQSRLTIDEVLRFIRDGTYSSKFSMYLDENDKHRVCKRKVIDNKNILSGCTFLFKKELTPSDVGVLNRIVIPKKYAVKFFESEGELGFYDDTMRLWKFRYVYWKSSQSYVFTKGWSRFVRELKLKAKDTVSFYAYNRNRFAINVTYADPSRNKFNFLQNDEYDCQEPVSKGFRLFGVQIDQ